MADKQLFTAPVMIPEKVDAHGHIASEEVIAEGCYSYMEHCMNTNLGHMFDIDGSIAVPVANWVTLTKEVHGDREFPKGTWMQTWKIKNPELWKGCKDRVYNAFSICCNGAVVTEPEE